VTAPLLDEAIKKATIAWVAVGNGPALALWCMPLEGSLVIVSGPGEQSAPGLAEAETATVQLRGDTGGLIIVWDAVVARLAPSTDEWTTVAPQLAGRRLNAPVPADELVQRWAETGCAVVRLTPSNSPPVAAPDLPDDSQAASPRDTPARVPVRRPFHLHRPRRR
jgi:hypothetical protein